MWAAKHCSILFSSVLHQPEYFFLPTLLFFQRDWPWDPIFSWWLRLLIQRAKMASNYWTKLPKFVHRKYASLVYIDVGTLLQIAQQKTRKNHKKIYIQKKNYFRPTDPGIFLGPADYLFLQQLWYYFLNCVYPNPPCQLSWWEETEAPGETHDFRQSVHRLRSEDRTHEPCEVSNRPIYSYRILLIKAAFHLPSDSDCQCFGWAGTRTEWLWFQTFPFECTYKCITRWKWP